MAADAATEKTALVVGAGSGIGRATAIHLAESGLTTLAADIDADAVRALAKEYPSVVPLDERGWDATDPSACTDLVARAVEEAGRLDVLISTVGWTGISKFLEEDPDYWRRIVDLNLMSAIYLASAAGHAMREHGGCIVLTSSEAGKNGMAGESVYAATKGGVIALVKSLAREFARYGIRVNAVAPGVTSTPLLDSQLGEGMLDAVVRQIPLRRVGRPDEIAAALAYLAGDGAGYVTGQTLCVGGGLTMGS